MADAVVCVKDPNENLKDFNARLKLKCKEAEVTDVQLLVVDGQPVVILLAGQVEADADDVADANDAGETIKEGDLIPEDTPMIVQVCSVAALIPASTDPKGEEGDAATSERRCDSICSRASDGIIKIINANGTYYDWIPDPVDAKKPKQWLPKVRSFLAFAYERPEGTAAAPVEVPKAE